MTFKPRHRKNPLPKDSRTIPLKDDEGIWYACWWCGFTNKEGRSQLGGSASPSADDHLEAIIPSRPHDGSSVGLGGSINHFQTIMKEAAGGEAQKVRHTFESNVSSGCPHCGSLNWRGDY